MDISYYFQEFAERVSDTSAAISNIRYLLVKELKERDFEITYDFRGWFAIIEALETRLDEISAEIKTQAEFMADPNTMTPRQTYMTPSTGPSHWKKQEFIK